MDNSRKLLNKSTSTSGGGRGNASQAQQRRYPEIDNLIMGNIT